MSQKDHQLVAAAFHAVCYFLQQCPWRPRDNKTYSTDEIISLVG